MSDLRYWYLWCVVALALYVATLWLLAPVLNAFYGCIVCTQ